MELIPLLGKRYVKEILRVLDEHGPLNYGRLKKLSGCPDGTLTHRLNELEEAGLVKTYEKKSRYRLPQRICKITNLGKKALVLYEIDEELTQLGENQKIEYHIVSDTPEQHPTTT